MNFDYIEYIDKLIDLAVKEDIGDGDHTSNSTIPADQFGMMKLLVKTDGVIAGVTVAQRVFNHLDSDIKFNSLICDGQKVKVGDIVFTVEGRVVTLLQAERIVLNIMQRMSGIATKTALYVERLQGLNCKILDTRKTAPGMRALDKMAVAIGGGVNHRIGLFDMIMIKDNHIDFAGGVKLAIDKCYDYCKLQGRNLKIEVETRSLDDIREAIATNKVDRIMLDNFTPQQTYQAVDLIRSLSESIEIESSGGITIDTLRSYGEAGVDFISIGALTHQVESLDLSLKAID